MSRAPLLAACLLLGLPAACVRRPPPQPVRPPEPGVRDVARGELAAVVDRELDRVMENHAQREPAKRALTRLLADLLGQNHVTGLERLNLFRRQVYPERFDYFAEVVLRRASLQPSAGPEAFAPVLLWCWDGKTMRWDAWLPDPEHRQEVFYP